MGFEPHFNDTVGGPVTSMRDFREKLAAKARENTLATGIEHDYMPTDPRDRAAFGITSDAVQEIEASNRGVLLDGPKRKEHTGDVGGYGEPPPLVGEKT